MSSYPAQEAEKLLQSNSTLSCPRMRACLPSLWGNAGLSVAIHIMCTCMRDFSPTQVKRSCGQLAIDVLGRIAMIISPDWSIGLIWAHECTSSALYCFVVSMHMQPSDSC